MRRSSFLSSCRSLPAPLAQPRAQATRTSGCVELVPVLLLGVSRPIPPSVGFASRYDTPRFESFPSVCQHLPDEPKRGGTDEAVDVGADRRAYDRGRRT